FAEWLAEFANSTGSRFNLVAALVEFFRSTGGRWGAQSLSSNPQSEEERKGLVHFIRPNRDVAQLRLSSVLSIAAQFLDGSLKKEFIFSSLRSKAEWKVDVDMNGTYSRWFGRWSGETAEAVRSQVIWELTPLCHLKGVADLAAKVQDGSSGEAMIVINACKALQVMKNWALLARSALPTHVGI
ncbi:unnamed protein product, partial [Durusdinium trenchii]